jgi:signal transduction histidine kinase
VFRSLTARWDPVAAAQAGKVPGAGDLPGISHLSRVLCLAVVVVTVFVSAPAPGLTGHRLAVSIALAISAVAWIAWIVAGTRQRLMVGAMIVSGAAGGALAALIPASGAMLVGTMMTFTAGAQLSTEISLGLTAETIAAFLVSGLVAGLNVGFVFGFPVAFLGFWIMGLTRRAYIIRAESAERLLSDARRMREAETAAAALAERARIAREIHDVLAHSLAAVSVNLQAAEGLLSAVPTASPELAKAIDCIARAGTLTREGLADARRAVLALRDDAAPLPDQLSSLASAGDLEVDFDVTGEPRPLSAGAGLAAYRTAQEALTNARKHAPGQPVRLSLGFEPEAITVRVVNPLARPGPLAGTGAGYGLTGLRERAALVGGTLDAGPADGQWQVCLRIPDSITGTPQ